MQAVILAGGLGTRLRPFTDRLPKPLYPINGKPYLYYLLKQVVDFGIRDIILLLGYKASAIVDYIGTVSFPNLRIQYSITPAEFDTGARIREAEPLIKEDFLLLYCDNYCPISWEIHENLFHSARAAVCLTAYANRDGYTQNNLRVIDSRVEVYDKSRTREGLNAVDIGYALISRRVLDWLPRKENFNFEQLAYQKALKENALYASVTEHRYYSIGSYERLPLTQRFFSSPKAAFLDRDGTLNVRPPKACYVEKTEDFQWLPGGREAVKLLNDAGWLVLLVSNQPGIARGRLTEEILCAIHEKMNQELAQIGAKIDKIYCCTHDWDEGCFCRKPQPGMLYEAQRDFDLDIPHRCILFGDDERDLEAAHRANCSAVQITDKYPLLTAVTEFLSRN